MVFLEVDGSIFRMSHGEIVNSFFSTISYNLEKKWGARFPYTMKKLYKGKLKYRDIDKARRELLVIKEELKDFPPSKAIYDFWDLSQQVPWNIEGIPEITDLSNYFITENGYNYFETILRVFELAEQEKQDVIIRSIDLDDPSVLHFDCRQ